MARWIVVWMLAALLLLALTPTAQAAMAALLLFPHLFPTPPVRPLDWVTGEPERTTLHVMAPVELAADVYLPAGDQRRGALIVVLGARPLPNDDPYVIQVMSALARAGPVVALAVSERLNAGRVEPVEPQALAALVGAVRAHPRVDAERVGFLGFSVGGSLALVAAAQPEVRDKIRFVHVAGAYHSALELTWSVVTERMRYGGQVAPWQPAPLAREVVRQQLVALLAADAVEAERLAAALATDPPGSAPAGLSANGQLAYKLAQRPDPAAADALLAQLPPAARQHLAAISPAGVLDQVRAPVYMFHDQHDPFVPYVESRRIRDALAPRGPALYDEFTLFEHVVPSRATEGIALAGELARLYRHIYTTLREVR
jgi:dienelactone hydrolase